MAAMFLHHDGGATVTSGTHDGRAAWQDGFDVRIADDHWFLNIGSSAGTGKHRSSRQHKIAGHRKGLGAKLFMTFLDGVEQSLGTSWLTETMPVYLTCSVRKRSRPGRWPSWEGFATHYELDYGHKCFTSATKTSSPRC